MKLHIFEGGYRVPGIVRWPGRSKPGTVCDEPVCNVDLLPTVCAAVGIEPPKDRALDGASFLPIFDGKHVERKVPLYWQYDVAISKPWKLSLLRDGWKLIGDAKESQYLLFNLSADIAEKHDLAKEEPDRVRNLAELLKQRHAEIKSEGSR